MKNKYSNLKLAFTIFIVLLLIYGYSLPRYIFYLPTIPVYPNNLIEANQVLQLTRNRTKEDIDFFKLTDPSIVYAFAPYVNLSIKEMNDYILQPWIKLAVGFFKYSFNRPRPYQINNKIDYLESNTGNSPSYPSGHAFQAYCLAYYLSKKYPENKKKYWEIAKKCQEVRVLGGVHFPSDGLFSKKLVDFFYKFY
jgi:membrane-associated phospholipid phosphatase